MKTQNYADKVEAIVERDELATDNLKALSENNRTYAHTVNGKVYIGVDPVIYRNVADAIKRLALVRHYKGGNLALNRVKARSAR
jgi:hypothetical protein